MNPYTPAAPDHSSAKSVGYDSSWGTASQHASPALCWGGSERSKTPFSSTSSYHVGSQASISNGSSWGTQSTVIPNPWSASPAPSYVGSPGSIASSATLVEGPIGVQALSQFGYPSALPVSPTSVSLHSDLRDARRLRIDMAGAPPSLNYHPSLAHSAFTPTMTYMEIHFAGFPHWTLRVHTERGLSVFAVVSHVYYHLQAQDGGGGGYSYPSVQRPPYGRDQSVSASSFNAGCRRIDILGQRTRLMGFKPAAGPNAWIAYLS